jgi:pilus assembly protein CpaB
MVAGMQRVRASILLLAVLSGGGSAMMVRASLTPPPAAVPSGGTPMVEVLVMARTAAAGETIGVAELRWQPWPATGVPAGAISREPGMGGAQFEPALARFPLIEGEPVAEAKLVRPGKGGTLAALTAAGRRAVAVPLREESAAGGLVQPNDRVDVIWTPASGETASERAAARTLLRRVRVLAIGKSLHAGGRGEARTATLELTPAEARVLAGARIQGEITLALVPAIEQGEADEPAASDAAEAGPVVRIIRYGR